jgi:serine/threonine protein kinase
VRAGGRPAAACDARGRPLDRPVGRFPRSRVHDPVRLVARDRSRVLSPSCSTALAPARPRALASLPPLNPTARSLARSLAARARAGLPLEAVRPLLYQLLLAVAHCHANRVLHRDIKPHNILMQRTPSGAPGAGPGGGRPWTLKLADFGLARIFNLPLRAYTHEVVTLWYRSPEILLGMRAYSWSVDIWSVACLLAEMLNGKPLFPGDSEIDQLLRVFRGLGTPTAERWPGVQALPEWKSCFPKWQHADWAALVPALAADAAGQELIGAMLRYDPDERITAHDALNHPFFDCLDKSLFQQLPAER